MSPARGSDTIVIQTFRNHSIPHWIQRCLDSVRNWAQSHRHDYSLAGDEFFELCGPEYLARGDKNPRAITNLARLVATRQHLDAGYQKVIWMDADMFVFDPARLVFDFRAEDMKTGYAFGREIWVDSDAQGLSVTPSSPHNAAMFFTPKAVDLDMLITLIRHIDAHRDLISNFQVGVSLLRGLQYSLMFPTISHVAMFSPVLIHAIAKREEQLLKFYAEAYRYKACAANLCLSFNVTEDLLVTAMDRLESSTGNVVNRYATESGVHLVPYRK